MKIYKVHAVPIKNDYWYRPINKHFRKKSDAEKARDALKKKRYHNYKDIPKYYVHLTTIEVK